MKNNNSESAELLKFPDFSKQYFVFNVRFSRFSKKGKQFYLKKISSLVWYLKELILSAP
jgi:hypothetical protein